MAERTAGETNKVEGCAQTGAESGAVRCPKSSADSGAEHPAEPAAGNAIDWPPYPEASAPAGLAEKLFQAQLDARLARLDAETAKEAEDHAAQIANGALDYENEIKQDNTFYEAVHYVAKGSIDRARSSAELVQKAATGIIAIHAAILGVAFSVTDRPLPVCSRVPGDGHRPFDGVSGLPAYKGRPSRQ